MADPVLCLSFGEIFYASSILHTKCLLLIINEISCNGTNAGVPALACKSVISFA